MISLITFCLLNKICKILFRGYVGLFYLLIIIENDEMIFIICERAIFSRTKTFIFLKLAQVL
jgi:hypothetical protein